MSAVKTMSYFSLDGGALSTNDLLSAYEPNSETRSAYDYLADPTGAYYLIGERGVGKTHVFNVLETQLKINNHDAIHVYINDWRNKITQLKNEYPDIRLSDFWEVEILKTAIEKLLQSDDDRRLLPSIKKKLLNQHSNRLDNILKQISLKHTEISTKPDIGKSIETLRELLWEILTTRQKEKPIVYDKENELFTKHFPSSRSLYIFIDGLDRFERIEFGFDDIVALTSLVKEINSLAIRNLGKKPNFKVLIEMETQIFRYTQPKYVDLVQNHQKIYELSWSTESLKRLLVRRILSNGVALTEELVTETLQIYLPEHIHYFGIDFSSSIDFIFEITGLNPRRVFLFLKICAREAGYSDDSFKSTLSAQEIINALKKYSEERTQHILGQLFFIYPDLQDLLDYLSAHKERIQRVSSYDYLANMIRDYLAKPKPVNGQSKRHQESPLSILDTLYRTGVIGILVDPKAKGEKFDWTQTCYISDDPYKTISSHDYLVIHPALWNRLTDIKNEVFLHRRYAFYLYSTLLDTVRNLQTRLEIDPLDDQIDRQEVEESIGRFLVMTKLVREYRGFPETVDSNITGMLNIGVNASLELFSLTPFCPAIQNDFQHFMINEAADFYANIMLEYYPTYSRPKIKFCNTEAFVKGKSDLETEYSKIQSPWIKGQHISPKEHDSIKNFSDSLVKENGLNHLVLNSLNILKNMLDIPEEILDKLTDTRSIINFISQAIVVGEIKILIVGQGSVGKTSLINRMISNKFDINESKTDGISINRWQVEDDQTSVFSDQSQTDNQLPVLQLNVWDFGGQEIMHATHQFFLTKRSLYLLVVDARNGQEQNEVEYWLKIIQSFGGESPVLIVGNKIDQHPLDIDRTGLQKKYHNIVGILETSAATGEGIEKLKIEIIKQVNLLPHVRERLSQTWLMIKAKLEEMGHESDFITHDKYLDLCAENEVSDETSQRTLLGFLHDLGVVLHFQDDPRLEALGILNPQWVTNDVYKILNSHTLFQNKGVLTTSMLDEILNLPEYPRGKRLFIVDMMKKFELCYDMEPDKTFLVPDLLPKDQPDLKFNGIPAFEYAYPVLPSSVITRFIVRMNQKIDDGFVWRTGVVLKIGENKALVKADIEDRKITIAIDGVEHTRRDALSAIRYQLDEIHASIKGLNPEKRVPIPEAPNAEPLEYEYLLMLEREGQEIYLAKDGKRLVKVNIRELLSGIESEAQRKESAGNVTNYYIAGDVNASGDFIGRDKRISAGDRGIVVDGNAEGNLVSGDENEVN